MGYKVFVMDRLTEMYNLQKQLHDRVTKDNPRFPKNFEQRLFAIAYPIQNECTEAQNDLSWKWWSKKKDIDEQKLKDLQEEWIDIFHFWLDGAIELNMTPSDIKKVYKKKNKVNHQRQDNGY